MTGRVVLLVGIQTSQSSVSEEMASLESMSCEVERMDLDVQGANYMSGSWPDDTCVLCSMGI